MLLRGNKKQNVLKVCLVPLERAGGKSPLPTPEMSHEDVAMGTAASLGGDTMGLACMGLMDAGELIHRGDISAGSPPPRLGVREVTR